VIATLLYPNRSFSTVINGTLSESNTVDDGEDVAG
jgi:hypothetical protein